MVVVACRGERVPANPMQVDLAVLQNPEQNLSIYLELPSFLKAQERNYIVSHITLVMVID